MSKLYQDRMQDYVRQEDIFEYLETLRLSGVTNMFGASPYLEEVFDLGEKTAVEALSDWMKSYKK